MAAAFWPPPRVPREYGAWVMLGLPLVLGTCLVGARPSTAWLVPPAVVLVFLAHLALEPVMRRRRAGKPASPAWSRSHVTWACIYLATASVSYAVVILFTPATHRTMLLVLSGAALLAGGVFSGASYLGAGRHVAIELLGMAAMTLSAPIMAVASGATIDGRPAAASAVAFAYSASALAFVRAYGSLERARRIAIIGCVATHVVLFAALVLISALQWASPWLFLVFVPVAIRTAVGLARPPRTIRAVGLRELWVSAAYTLLAAAVVSL